MKALLILAHGSRRDASNHEIEQLVEKVRSQAANDFSEITHAFLELAEPDIRSSIATLIDKDATSILVLPYFLNSGNHVTQDIPALINQVANDYPDCQFYIAKPIGMHQDMPALVLQCARQAQH